MNQNLYLTHISDRNYEKAIEVTEKSLEIISNIYGPRSKRTASKWYQKAKATFWQGLNLLMGLVFFFFVVKNQALPIIRKRFGLYESILLEKE